MQPVFLPTVTSICLCKSFWLGAQHDPDHAEIKMARKQTPPSPQCPWPRLNQAGRGTWATGQPAHFSGMRHVWRASLRTGERRASRKSLDPGIVARGVCGGNRVSGNHQLARRKLVSHEKRGAGEGLHDSGENENPDICLELRSQDRRLTSVLPNSLCWLYKSRHFTRSRCR